MNQRHGFVAVVGEEERQIRNDELRTIVYDVRFRQNGRLFRKHLWMPSKYINRYRYGDMITFSAVIDAYRGKNFKKTLVKIDKIKKSTKDAKLTRIGGNTHYHIVCGIERDSGYD